MVASCDGSRQLGNLFGCLPLTEDDLGKTLADGSIVIESREPEVFDAFSVDGGTEPSLGFLGGKVTGANGVEERPERG